MPKALFRYSGNKGRMLGFYRHPPKGTKRIVEPYLGSGAYTLNHDLPGLGFDNNPFVVDLWHWLQTPPDLDRLGRVLTEARAKDPKHDIRTLGLTHGEMLYLKINVCGLVIGQWSSWGLYPQHDLPIARTKKALGDAQRVKVNLGSGSDYTAEAGDMLFIDPPYVGTHGNYKTEQDYSPEQTLHLIQNNPDVPMVLTYGDGAPETFPGLPWEIATGRQVPNFRCGGTVGRIEYVAYLNWPEPGPANVWELFGSP